MIQNLHVEYGLHLVNGLHLYNGFIVFGPFKALYNTNQHSPIHTLMAGASIQNGIWGSLSCPIFLLY